MVPSIEKIGNSFGYRKKDTPDHLCSCLGPNARTKYITIFYAPMVCARDAGGGVEWWCGERGTGKCSKCEKSSDSGVIVKCLVAHAYFVWTFISWYLRNIFKLATSSFSAHQFMNWGRNKCWWMEYARKRLPREFWCEIEEITMVSSWKGCPC